MSRESHTEENGDEPYEIVETPGVRQDVLSELLSMDLSQRTALQQVAIGGVSGWFAGYMCKKIGKLTISAIGGGILILQIAHRTGYIKINWNKVEKDMNKVSREVEREVYNVTQGQETTNNQLLSWAKRGVNHAKRNMSAAAGFAGGLLIGMAF